MQSNISLASTNKVVDSILKGAVTSTFISLGLVLSTIFVFIPNFEFISITIFVITLLFGGRYGFFATIAISSIYELIVTPIYGAAGVLFFVKLFCYLMLVGIISGSRKVIFKLDWWELGVIGTLFSLIYDAFTTIMGQVLIIQSDITLYYIITVLVMGFPFTLNHILTNFILFSLSKTIIKWTILAFKHRSVKIMLPRHIMELKN